MTILLKLFVKTAWAVSVWPVLGSVPGTAARVGLVFDLTDTSGEVVDLMSGFDLAIEDSGSRIETRKYDSKRDAIGTVSAMKSMLESPPDIIVAEINSSKAFVAAEIAEEAKRLLIVPLASAPDITRNKKYVFRTSYADDFQGARLARFARDSLKASRAAIFLDVGQLYSKSLSESFKSAFSSIGGTVVREERVAGISADFSESLSRLKDKNIDVIFLPLYEDLAARIINQATRLGVHPKAFVGGDGWYPRDIFADLVNPRTLPFDLYWVEQFELSRLKGALLKLVARIEKRAGKKINASIAAGYDTGLLVATLLKRTQKNRSQDSLLKAIQEMPPLAGLCTTYAYKGKHNPDKSLFIHKLTGGSGVFFSELKP